MRCHDGGLIWQARAQPRYGSGTRVSCRPHPARCNRHSVPGRRTDDAAAPLHSGQKAVPAAPRGAGEAAASRGRRRAATPGASGPVPGRGRRGLGSLRRSTTTGGFRCSRSASGLSLTSDSVTGSARSCAAWRPDGAKLQRTVGSVMPRGLSVALLAPDGAASPHWSRAFARPPGSLPFTRFTWGSTRDRPEGAGNTGPGGRAAAIADDEWRRSCRPAGTWRPGASCCSTGLPRALLPYAGSRGPSEKTAMGIGARLSGARPGRRARCAWRHVFARKGERTPSVLEQQRQWFREICLRLRRGVPVDACCDAGELRRQVTALMWRCYRARPPPHRPGPPLAWRTGHRARHKTAGCANA